MGQPFTVKHGSWAPDLQNVAVQIPYQYTATEVPSADVSDVFYQDGAFRCLPAPNPYAYAVGVILSTTFVCGENSGATSFGFRNLPSSDPASFGSIANPIDANGNPLFELIYTGGALTLQILASELGATYFSTLAIATGASPVATYEASAAAYSYINHTNTWTWSGAAALVNGVTYALLLNSFDTAAILNAFTYYDDVANQEVLFAGTSTGIAALIDGVWSLIPVETESVVQGVGVSAKFSLSSTATGAALSATFGLNSGTAQGQLYASTLIAGAVNPIINDVGYSDGNFEGAQAGSLTPPTDFSSAQNTISALHEFGVGATWYLQIAYLGTLPQNYVSTLQINGLTFNSSDATLQQNGTYTWWNWQGQTPLVGLAVGVSYPVVLNF